MRLLLNNAEYAAKTVIALAKCRGISMYRRLTRSQMAEQYPHQWLGLKNVKYHNDNGVTLESGEIVFTDKTEEELLMMQVKNTGIIAWYTTDDVIILGVAGAIL